MGRRLLAVFHANALEERFQGARAAQEFLDGDIHIARVADLVDFLAQLHAGGLSKEAEAKLRRGDAINQLIVQDKNKPVSMEEQIVYLHALNSGILDNLSAAQIAQFKQDILPFLSKRSPEFCAKIRETREMSEDLKVKLEETLKAYIKEAIK